MKNRSALVGLSLTAVLAMLLLMLSCGTGQQNENQNQNQNQGVAGVQPTAIFDDPACDATDIVTKRDNAQTNLETAIGKDKQLKDGRIKVLVKVVDNRYLETLVEGEAKGEDELEDLSKIIRKFMKDECVLKVSFVPRGTIPGGTVTRGELFEWTACEHPQVPCNGVCEYPCVRASPSPGNSRP